MQKPAGAGCGWVMNESVGVGLTIAGAMALVPVIDWAFRSLHEFLASHPDSKLCRFLLWEWK